MIGKFHFVDMEKHHDEIFDLKLSAHAKLTFLYLYNAYFNNIEGRTTIEDICQGISTSIKNVDCAMNELVEAGILKYPITE